MTRPTNCRPGLSWHRPRRSHIRFPTRVALVGVALCFVFWAFSVWTVLEVARIAEMGKAVEAVAR